MPSYEVILATNAKMNKFIYFFMEILECWIRKLEYYGFGGYPIAHLVLIVKQGV